MVDFFIPNVDDSIFSEIQKEAPLHLDDNKFSDFFSKLDVKIKKTGGTTVNILKTIAKFGANCFFSGSTGMKDDRRDEDAIFFQKEMAKNKVECQLFSRNAPTGRFLSIYNSKGEKAIVVNVGAAKFLDATQINEIRFAHSFCFVMEGMQFLNNAVLEQIVDYAFRYNVPLAVDCGTVFGAEAVGKRLADIGQSLEVILFANEKEIDVLKKHVDNPSDYCFILVEKLGEKGANVYFDGEKYFQPAFCLEGENQVLEDTGAGDAFAGKFLYSIFENIENSIMETTFENVKIAAEEGAKEASSVLSGFGV